ncbi:hypothetical protein VOLCADRAFT_92998 [Volvox carteri f. nagariensis]|uniref:Uncharacterized protein n=1 Tax=Volvox carteri f. nagariensis TaxID=3068 RepID=D8U124_VOLCA|nr:uncharacterized protein VOLCADRAFT_92998 [Volvox carteri f. nagariensis]EFJ46558.1 hypothetical protein VOLCADRAFT_92998 [Volvox carteri f. nagariensis]|eukprot:XP_002952415.1 hypothetical protein VOLCADRAFT_92998 [Volvox carteri f. nagariensis]
MALSGGHSTNVAEDESPILAGRQRAKRIPVAALQAPPKAAQGAGSAGSGGDGGGGGGGVVRRMCRSVLSQLPGPLWLQDALPGGRRRRQRREAKEATAAEEAVVLGAPVLGWPRDDVPGLYSSLSWLVSRMAVNAVATAALPPVGPMGQCRTPCVGVQGIARIVLRARAVISGQ